MTIKEYLKNNENNYKNMNKKEFEKDDCVSLKSNDTDTALNYMDLFASYDCAKDAIKHNSGDKTKLQKIHFETKDNKIILCEEEKSKVKATKLDFSLCSKSTETPTDESQKNKSSDSKTDSIEIFLEEYSLDKNEEFVKKDFLKANFNKKIKKNFI
jgi:hypothetical protein